LKNLWAGRIMVRSAHFFSRTNSNQELSTMSKAKTKKTLPPGSVPLNVINLEEARFECTYGRGCEGLCCKNSRPPIGPETAGPIEKIIKKALPMMRPNAKKLVEKVGFLSNRKKSGGRSIRVVDNWCVFFNKGCVLHNLGAAEGDTLKYKPVLCALFPVERHGDGWYVRQAGFGNEQWDLFCLTPKPKTPPAREGLAYELDLAARCDNGER